MQNIFSVKMRSVYKTKSAKNNFLFLKKKELYLITTNYVIYFKVGYFKKIKKLFTYD
jgi:hypothetical protein